MRSWGPSACVVVWVAWLGACGDEPAPSPPRTPPPAPAATSVASPSPHASTDVPAPAAEERDAGTTLDPALDAAAREAVRTAVREGRAAAEAHRYDDALARFRAAVAIDQSNRRLRCEAGFVAHLGGHEDEAETLIDAALAGMPDVGSVPAGLRVAYAQCLFNAGLVYQVRGDDEGARRAWSSSLALRPNDVVRTHLEALPPAAAAEAERRLVLDAAMSTDAITNALVRWLMAARDAWIDEEGSGADDDEEDDDDEDDEDDEDDDPVAMVRRSVRMQALAGAPAGVDAWLFDVDPTLQSHDVVLVLRRGERIAAFEVLQVFNPGALGIWADGSVASTTFTDLVPGGAPELVIETEDGSVDDDLGGCVSYASEERVRIVCTLDGALACVRLPVSASSSESCDPECIGEWDEQCGHDFRPPEGERVTGGHTVGTTWSEGRATITVEGDADHSLPAGLAGTHDLGALLRISPLPAL